jgi:hypothetical protein
MVTTFSGFCFAQNDPWCCISYDKSMSHFLSTFDKIKTAWELVRIPSCEHFFISRCRQSGLHWGKTAYMGQCTVGLNPISKKYFYNRIHVLYTSSSASCWKQAKKFGTCCVNKMQLLLRRLLPIRRVLSIKIKFVCITELYVSRLWQISTALWQQQGGINIVQEFWVQCHVKFFIYNRINKIYLPTQPLSSSVFC